MVEYATSTDCVWVDLAVTGETVDDITKQRPLWRGYAILPEGQDKKRGALDESPIIDIDEPRVTRKRKVVINSKETEKKISYITIIKYIHPYI